IEGGNPTRIESNVEAVQIDRALRDLWQGHRRFVMVPHRDSFFAKIQAGFAAMREIVDEHLSNGDAPR
ncbi:MAG: hypothetical protein KC619_22025, partial [Myxococcales bacterium]|nr:hypothetical protein [Myxococcales bacterium]